MKWTYSFYRATLKLNGKFFSLVTPDGRNALDENKAKQLLDTLSRGTKRPKKNFKKLYKQKLKVLDESERPKRKVK